jgi:hypothetical protein
MATGTLLPNVFPQFCDANGDPYAGYLLFVFAAGTTTKIDTYSDVALTVPNPNPMTLDSAGRPSSGGSRLAIYLSAQTSVDVQLALPTDTDPPASPVLTQDNVGAVPPSTVDVDVSAVAGEALTAGQAVYLSAGTGGTTAGRWYRTDGDLSYASSLAGETGIVIADIDSGETGQVRLLGRVTTLSGLTAGLPYYASGTAGALTSTAPTFARIIGYADGTTSLVVSPTPPVPVRSARPPGGRLTLTTAVPVTTSDVTAATAVRYTPYIGTTVDLYDGSSRWLEFTFPELSISIAGYTADMNFDMFLYDNGGAVALESLAWTNSTTRATALALQDGKLVKSGAATRLYIGTIGTTGTVGQTEDSYAKRYVWNYYHRVVRPLRVLPTADSWSYNTATLRQWNALTSNQLGLVCGVSEDAVDVTAIIMVNNSGSNETMVLSIGEDSTSAAATGVVMASWNTVTGIRQQLIAQLRTIPAVGRHYYAGLEYASAGGTGTWYGDNGTPTLAQSGLTGIWRA